MADDSLANLRSGMVINSISLRERVVDDARMNIICGAHDHHTIEVTIDNTVLMAMRLLSAGFADSSRKGKTYNGCIFGSGRCTAPHREDS